MSINPNDLVEGLDASVLVELSGSQLNQLVRLATPSSDRYFGLLTDEDPDVVANPILKRFDWRKPSENGKILRRYNDSTASWEEIGGALSVGTDNIQDGAITYAKLQNPDLGHAYWILRVNATSTGWEIAPFSVTDDSLAITKITRGPASTIPHIKSDGSGWEFVLPDDIIGGLSAKVIAITKLNSGGINGGVLTTGIDGSSVIVLPPGTNGQLLRLVGGIPTWSNEVISPITLKSIPTAQNLPAGFGTLTFAHSIGTIPALVRVVLVSISDTTHGFSVGDEVDITSFFHHTSNNEYPMVVRADATNVYITFRSYAIGVNRPDSDAGYDITRTDWQVKVYALN